MASATREGGSTVHREEKGPQEPGSIGREPEPVRGGSRAPVASRLRPLQRGPGCPAGLS